MAFVIEDDRRVRLALERVLARVGFRSTSFSSLSDLELATPNVTQPPTAVLADLRLEFGTTGFDAVDHIKRSFSCSPPVLFISGHELEDDLASRVSAYDAAFKAKPVAHVDLHTFLLDAAVRSARLHPALRHVIIGLAAAHHLNIAQARILASLARGTSRGDLASDLGVGENTVKWQIKTLLHQTAAESTNELLSRMLQALSSGAA